MNEADIQREFQTLRRTIEALEKRVKWLEDKRKDDERAARRFSRY